MTPRVTPAESGALPNPYGVNGVRLSALNAGSASSTNAASAVILMTTRTMLSVALSRVPADQQSGDGERHHHRRQIDDATGVRPGEQRRR